MELKQVIMNRRSIRVYQDKMIDEKDILEIMEAGINAPSAVNYQPWYFVVVKSPEKMKELVGIMANVAKTSEENLIKAFPNRPEVAEETGRFISRLGGAPVCVLAFKHRHEYGKSPATIIQSVAGAIENMILTATDKGIGSCWLTAGVESDAGDLIREKFAPDKGELVALVTLGFSAQEPKAPPRKGERYIIM
jgi:nitroreductase